MASQDGNREGSKTEGDTARGKETETVIETQRQSVEQVEEEQFNYANLSSKIILAKPDNPDYDINLIVYHSGKFKLFVIYMFCCYRGWLLP